MLPIVERITKMQTNLVKYVLMVLLSITLKKLPWSNLCFAYLLLKNSWTIWCIPVPNLIFFIANFLLKTSNLWIWRKRIKATHDCACLLCRYNHSRNLNFHGFEPTKFNILKLKKYLYHNCIGSCFVNLWCPSCGLVYYLSDW